MSASSLNQCYLRDWKMRTWQTFVQSIIRSALIGPINHSDMPEDGGTFGPSLMTTPPIPDRAEYDDLDDGTPASTVTAFGMSHGLPAAHVDLGEVH